MNAPNPLPNAFIPQSSAVANAIGAPALAVVTVSVLNRFVFKAVPLTAEEAAGYGAFGAALLGYLIHVVKTLIDRKAQIPGE
jgi:hypothetical protein